MNEFEKEITDQIRTSFNVSSIPIGLLKEFKEYCEKECGNVYWVGIFQLLKTKKEHELMLTNFSLKNSESKIKKEVTFGNEQI